jgi:hypothetical protein
MISVSVECSPSNNLQNINHIEVVDYVNEDCNDDIDCGNSVESISPRIIHSSNQNIYANTEILYSPYHGVRDVLYPEEEMSPISIPSSPIRINESVGDCGICYKQLPLHSNHVFTICGHLFCVKCLFNWNNTSSTCPMCRKVLYENIANLDTSDTPHFIWPNNIDNADNIDNEDSSSDMSNETYDNSNDVIEWSDDPYEGDMLINDISQIERTQLTNFRTLSLDIYRRKIYKDSLVTNKIFTGQLPYQFIPRNHYIYLNVGIEHLYEFVIRKNTWDDNMDEINFLGHILEFNVNYSEDDEDEENLLVIILHPQFIEQCYNQDTNTITFVRLNFKFSNVRRMYSICPVHEQ